MDGFNPFTGGLFGLMMGGGGVSLPDPYQFLNPLYDMNPFGQPLSQMSYGAHFGHPQSSFQPAPQFVQYPGQSHTLPRPHLSS